MRRLGAGIALLLAFGVCAPGSASAAKADAKVVITGYTPLLMSNFHGKVSSERKACEKKRKVILYRRAGDDNEKIGSAKTYKDGDKWRWEVFAQAEGSKYFALAPETEECRREESKIFELE